MKPISNVSVGLNSNGEVRILADKGTNISPKFHRELFLIILLLRKHTQKKKHNFLINEWKFCMLLACLFLTFSIELRICIRVLIRFTTHNVGARTIYTRYKFCLCLVNIIHSVNFVARCDTKTFQHRTQKKVPHGLDPLDGKQ